MGNNRWFYKTANSDLIWLMDGDEPDGAVRGIALAEEWLTGVEVEVLTIGRLSGKSLLVKCPNDTDADGNCGRRYCPYCGNKRQIAQSLSI